MKTVFILLLSFCGISSFAQQPKNEPDKNKPVLIVDAACGECKLGLKGKSCDLAIRMDGKSYFVDGTDIDSHGDAHAKNGFCNAVRKAKVQGGIVNGRFKASFFQLLPEAEAKKD